MKAIRAVLRPTGLIRRQGCTRWIGITLGACLALMPKPSLAGIVVIDGGFAVAVAVDGSGDVIAAGLSNAPTGSAFTVIKFRGSDGTVLWQQLIAVGDATSVAVDGSGDVIAAGSTGGDFTVMKLSGATGAELWRREIDGTASVGDRANSDLILVGITYQCCVHSTLRDAVDRGYWCLTLDDCCAALSPELDDAVRHIIRSEDNLFGWIASSSSLTAALA